MSINLMIKALINCAGGSNEYNIQMIIAQNAFKDYSLCSLKTAANIQRFLLLASLDLQRIGTSVNAVQL